MIYPSFIKESETIGICAPSQGTGHKLEDFTRSIHTLEAQGFVISETASVRNQGARSASAEIRAAELVSLFSDPEVKMVMSAAGGDFLFEILPYVDFETMKNNPKWLMGASDPTGILYPYTTRCDTATLYGCNGGSFDMDPLPEYLQKALDFIAGRNLSENSYPMHLSKPPFLAESLDFDTPTRWLSNTSSLQTSGRCLGGCIDVLKDLIGTAYDGTAGFIRKYHQDGIIWYFDNFSLSAEMFYRTLLQMKYAGWFTYAKAVLVGRVCFASSETGMSYEDALNMALGDIPVIYEADIGHTIPAMMMINGAILDIDYKDEKASLKFSLR